MYSGFSLPILKINGLSSNHNVPKNGTPHWASLYRLTIGCESHHEQNVVYQISNSTISWVRLDRKHYVLESRFGADPGQRNREILKWRDPLGVTPC